MSNYLIITGGSRGIGEKTIACFIRDGWKIINISRTISAHPDIKNFQIDLSVSKNVEEYTAKFQQELASASKICLVHNAAYYKRDCVDTLAMDDLKLTLETNLISAIKLNKILIPHMLPGSSIIYIGSTLAEKAVPGSASYTISKHAIVGLMRATCQDLMDKKIRSCCVCPGLVDTQLLKETMDDQTLKYLLDTKIIGKRLIEPEEIADVIHFCANSTAINGAVIYANLGQVAD